MGALAAIGWSERVEASFQSVAPPGARPGRVIAVDRGASRIAVDDGATVTGGPGHAVGDWIVLDDVQVVDVLPRWSELARLDPGHGRQVLAANLDIILIAAPADRLSLARVERELVVAWDSGARPIVLITKADMATPELADEIHARLPNADTIFTSVTTGAGLAELAGVLGAPNTAVLFGPSGAGKSTLLNVLVGDTAMPTADVREEDRRGRHTTTSRRLVPLPSGGCLIDMPGLRGLGLDVDDASVAAAFADIDELTSACRFDDCRHDVEPGCAVIAAAESGELSPERLASYRKLQRESGRKQGRDNRR